MSAKIDVIAAEQQGGNDGALAGRNEGDMPVGIGRDLAGPAGVLAVSVLPVQY
jgi:hypothetical protein